MLPDCASDLDDMVEWLKKTFLIEIKGLFYSVSRDGRGKLQLQPLPGLALFLMWPNLADVETIPV